MLTLSAQFDPQTGWPAGIAQLNSASTLALVFGGSCYQRLDTEAWAALRQLLPDALLAGCSSSGEILDDQVYDDTLTAMIVKFHSTTLRQVQTCAASVDESREAGRRVGEQLAGQPGLKGVFVLCDGLHINGSELAAGIASVLPGVAVTGGLAGDGTRFQETWVLMDGRPQSNGVTAIGFYGDELRFLHGCKGGWDKFGIERVVTRSKGSVVYELDGRPALALYKEYLGERAAGLPATGLLFPLAIRLPGDPEEKVLVRTILGVDESEQSLSFAGDIPQGSYAQLMKANFDRLVDGAAGAASTIAAATDPARNLQALAIAVSCVGRRLVLGERSEEELVANMTALPRGTRQIGFYSYGEISPLAGGGTCELHNQTMTITLLTEDQEAQAGHA